MARPVQMLQVSIVSHDIIGAGQRDRRQLIIAAERAAARSVTF